MNALPVSMQTVPLVGGSDVVMTFAAVRLPFAIRCIDQPRQRDFLSAGLGIVGAVDFTFRS